MADHTPIEWTDATWNPIVGCSLVSPGCTNCYAMRQAARIESMDAGQAMERFRGMTAQFLDYGTPEQNAAAAKTLEPRTHYAGTTKTVNNRAVWTGKVALSPEHILAQAMRWRRGRRIFVNSMSDLFHESVPDKWLDRIFAVMALCPQHTFQVLTKRPQRMRDYLSTRAGDWMIVWPDANPPGTLPVSRHEQRQAMQGAGWPDAILRPTYPLPNVWLGVSIEDQRRADERVPLLLATPAAVRWVSAEPLLGPIDLSFIEAATPEARAYGIKLDVLKPPRGLNWIVAGGESGPNARPMHPDWARRLRDQCAAADVPFLFKQWGEWAPWHTVDLHEGMERCVDGPDKRVNVTPDGRAFGNPHHPGDYTMYRVGKRAAGRLLDGVLHDAYPEVPHV